MKKFILIAALLLGAVAVSRAEQFDVPSGPQQALASADYGGVYYATMAFPVSGAGVGYSTPTLVPGPGSFHGVVFSSGNAGAYDWVDVWDSTSADITKSISPMVRLYNVAGSTVSSVGNISAASGFSGPKYPIKFGAGLIIRANTAAYNMITTLFYQKK